MDFKNFIEVRDVLISRTPNNDRRKLLYSWVTKNRITFEFFNNLIYHIK